MKKFLSINLWIQYLHFYSIYSEKHNLWSLWFCHFSIIKASIILWCTSNQLCIEDLAELWSRLGDRGPGKLLLSGLSVSDSPLLSDRCCRHRSMHHTLVKAPLLHPPPFRWKSTPQSHHTYIYVLTDTLTRRARTCSAHIQTPFPLWWQILPELAPICESWHGVLSESNSPVICPSQMDPRVVRGALSGGRGCTTLWI